MNLINDELEIFAPDMNISLEHIETLVKTKSDYINKTIAMEECSELIKEISKSIRGEKNRRELIEEMVDVIISVQILMKLEHIKMDDINKEYNKKMKRNLYRVDTINKIERIKQTALFKLK